MADVEISYGGSTIVSMDDSGTEVLETAGKFLTDDINILYTKAGGGTFSEINYVTSGTHNLNDYTNAGIYCFVYGVTMLNAPNNAADGFLVVLPDNAGSLKQLWHRTGDVTNTFKDEFVRTYYNSWSSWNRITEGIVLYSSNTGATSGTLSYSISNFTRVKVFAGSSTSTNTCAESFLVPNETSHYVLVSNMTYFGGKFYINSLRVELTGTSWSTDRSDTATVDSTSKMTHATWTNGKVFRIIAY